MPYAPNIVFRMRWMVSLALAAAVVALPVALTGSSSVVAPASAAAPVAAEPSGLSTLAAKEPGRRVGVIVQLRSEASISGAMSRVRELGGSTGGRLTVIHGFGADLSAAAAQKLSRDPAVRVVSLDARVTPQDVRASDLETAYPFSSGATDAWNGDTPATGKGVGVAVIDTGIAGDLPDFRVSGSDSSSRVIGSAVVHPDAATAADGYGHGTHVAGIIAGNGWRRGSLDPQRGEYIGVAPDANLISVKASDDAGNATVLDVIYGLQFVVDHKDTYNIRVVNLSLESTTPGSYKTDPLDAAVESAWFNGIVVVAAAGNHGIAQDAVSYAPGNDPYAISVGAVDDQGTKNRSDDLLAAWSSRGTTADGHAKPELVAPGSRIVSALAPGSAFTTMCATCIVGTGYIRAGGSSMSAPMVSGAVALLLERHPSLTPNQVKGVLMRSTRSLPDGSRAVSASKAIAAAAVDSSPANQGLTPNELVSATTGEIDYTRSSWSRSSWSDATGLLRSSWSRSSWSRSSWSSENLLNDVVDPTRSSWSRSSWSTSWTK